MKSLYLALFLILSVAIHVQAQDEPDSASCAECHSGTKQEIKVVTADMIDKSVHEGTECLECHMDIGNKEHKKDLKPVNCGECHEDAVNIYKKHGVYEVGKSEDIPTCANCHGNHDILSSSEKKSRTHRLNLPETCGTCHENPKLIENHAFLRSNAVETYKKSIHSQATGEGNLEAASCKDCHSTKGSAHVILSPGQPLSAINHFAIPDTCGNCHKEIKEEYQQSIHGQQALRGETDSPVCTNCHGEHRIYSPKDGRSAVSHQNVAERVCIPCHESANLIEKYGEPGGRLASYIDPYHGSKSKAGDTSVANCSDCHTTHLILTASNPQSSLNDAHLQETCGKCHDKISIDLAQTKIHEVGGTQKRGWPLFFTIVYTIIITVTVVGMMIYILIDYWRQFRNLLQKEQVRRMPMWGVLQHSMLAIVFIVLVITGFALRFSDSWWAGLLFGREGGFPIRNSIHRIAAVLFVLTALMHLFYLRGAKGREFMREIFPKLADLSQLIQMIKYNLGISKSHPEFGRFSFVEKFEYWALVWGGFIMAATGVMLWLDNFFIRYFPKVVLDVALVIHYYEAWLATLAILIWHSYSTIFSPRIYPMNPSWITGKMPKEQYIKEHTADAKEQGFSEN